MESTCAERPAEDESEEENPDSTESPSRIRDTPEDIVLEAPASGLAFHPTRDLLAAGDVDGDVFVFSYSCQEGETKELWSSGHHLKSCRAVVFSEDGQKLVTVSKDKAIHVLDVEQGRLERRISKAHSAPINSLLLVDENVLATGDDTGGVRLWDLRKEGPLMDMRQHEEYIADMALDPGKKLLLTASGDGCLGVFNIKRRRFELLSEAQSGDLTSVTLMKHGKKVACGSSEGTIYLFNWNGFGATSDRFALRAESIDCMIPVTESLLCTGSTDGIIRAVNILPNRVVGSVGQHAGEPVEELALSHCGRFLASSGHDQHVKFWDMTQLRAVVVDDYRRRKKKGGPLRALSSKAWSTDDFFAGLREEGEDSKVSEEEDSENDSD
ncbi:WD repeat domain 55 [Ictidomys tridecemlineatus]|uniref:WD repeat-containing protein 55 n=1 Tax=Ictidomys tridecemlineatus TaxID=43179 RepID=I3MUG0_ICTTR|nr:WD repeat-containing protein 55 [Ictidomys tridecemlineatus]KAG3266152.1 WD repeat domain 55 [Ictidomys tridecemlineatus]